MNWHKIASLALGIGGYAAAHFIPAGVVIPLGFASLPVGAAIAGVLALAAAVGVQPSQVSPGIAKFIDGLGKSGTKSTNDPAGAP